MLSTFFCKYCNYSNKTMSCYWMVTEIFNLNNWFWNYSYPITTFRILFCLLYFFLWYDSCSFIYKPYILFFFVFCEIASLSSLCLFSKASCSFFQCFLSQSTLLQWGSAVSCSLFTYLLVSFSISWIRVLYYFALFV